MEKKLIGSLEYFLNECIGVDNTNNRRLTQEEESERLRNDLRKQLETFELVDGNRALTSSEIDKILKDIGN